MKVIITEGAGSPRIHGGTLCGNTLLVGEHWTHERRAILSRSKVMGVLSLGLFSKGELRENEKAIKQRLEAYALCGWEGKPYLGNERGNFEWRRAYAITCALIVTVPPPYDLSVFLSDALALDW